MTGVYRTPDERFANLPDFPFAPHYVELEGLRMHYLDEGRGEPILLLHGEPTWSFLYRRMIPPLRTRFRCVAPDYIGFGRSDKWTDVAAYSFRAHYAMLERFVAALELRAITLVVQDWGGPLGLHYAVRHSEWIARLVILNTGLLMGEWEALRAFGGHRAGVRCALSDARVQGRGAGISRDHPDVARRSGRRGDA